MILDRCTRLKKENNEYRQQLSLNHSNDQQQQQIELLRQIVQVQKARQKRSADGRSSDSDMSDFSARGGSKLLDSDSGLRTSGSRRNSGRKRTSKFNQCESKDSTDSDIEGVSSPPVLRNRA
ncbi:unnamed protein product [Rotaria sp. Silwood2]|nr:unnamed protein product [Rotaria sp. Silwood2]CAF4415507.1 unnamed protein product [Rotaria sp. Silwood2]CAF4482217.1 unnamed protein product [Rotaria sp. Silwood2]CAF4557309.1 unnamed protein product [Rotaria sp. Silwood2]